MNLFKKVGVVVAGLLPVAAFAAVDITAITTGVTDAGAAIATVGVAITTVFIGIKVYKWIRRAL